MRTKTLDWPYSIDRTRQINAALEDVWKNHIPGRRRFKVINKYMLIDNFVYEVKEVIVHTFTMGDVEDPDLYAAEPLLAWQNSEMGQWVMTHAIDVPEWFRMADPISYGYKYVIKAKLMGPALTEWLLKYGK